MQIPHIQQVEPPPQANIEIHKIYSDLEEESGPSTFPLNILTITENFNSKWAF